VSSVYGPVPAVDKPLLAALYAAELSLLIMILAVHRLGDRVLASSLDSNPGMGFVVALLAFLVAAAIIARRYLRSRAWSGAV
jgi:PGF-CTERM protein